MHSAGHCSGMFLFALTHPIIRTLGKALNKSSSRSVLLHSLSMISHSCVHDSDRSRFFDDLKKEHDEMIRILFDSKSSEAHHIREEFEKRHSLLVRAMPVMEKRYEKIAEIGELQSLALDLKRAKDKELLQITEDELRKCAGEVETLENQILKSLIPDDGYDSDDVILEVVAGVGGQEAMLFAADIFHLYEGYAAFQGWNFCTLSYNNSDIGGIRSATAEISGNDAFKYLKFEAGVHRVQRVPKTEKFGRMHTSTTAVAVYPKPTDIDVVLNKKDLRFETCRSSGKGGQHVNKTDSAVRIVHIPSGIAVECQEERSQGENKERAMQRLAALLHQQQHDAQFSKVSSTRKIQVGNRARSDKIRTYNFVQDRITDHRIMDSCHNVSEFLSGGKAFHSLLQRIEEEYRREVIQEMISKPRDNSMRKPL